MLLGYYIPVNNIDSGNAAANRYNISFLIGTMGVQLGSALLKQGHRVLWCSYGRSDESKARANQVYNINKAILK